ncbi:uncharacterized protein [Dysidea avara]
MLIYGSLDFSGYYDTDDISFDLQSSNPFFFLANKNSSNTTILAQHGTNLPDKVESIQLLTAINNRIPLNDYEMTLEVTAGGIPLISSDIKVHVVEPLPNLSAPVTCIEFNHTKYSEVESVALLSVTLQLTGRLQLFPVDVIIIVSESTTGFTKDGYDFISDQYIATFSPNITQAVFNISLMKNSLDKSTEYLILHLYIPSDSYEYGVQKGNSTTAMVSVLLPGHVRLVNGADETEGRVEVYLNGQWGTVCDDWWNNNDANVVCRQLGFFGDSKALSNARFGYGSGPILLDNVQCVGNERSITDCPANAIGHHNCDHSDDAGVSCNLYTVTVISDPPEQYAGFDANFKCSVIPTPPSDSEYSWNCSTGCFADMETEQTVNVSNLEVTDEGVLNCSVMIGDLEFFSDPYNLMLSEYRVYVRRSDYEDYYYYYHYAGFDLTYTCLVIPTPPSDSQYSWSCSTGCFADMETEQSVNVSDLEAADGGVLNCSVMIGDLEYFSDPYYLQLSEYRVYVRRSDYEDYYYYYDHYAGFDVTYTCLVIPTPPSDSQYSWSCSTGCFADMETEQSVNVSDLEAADGGVLNCSVMIGDLEYFSDPYYLQLSDYYVTIGRDPPFIYRDNNYGYPVGSNVTLTCVVYPTPPSDSEYSWNCSTGCFADMDTEQSIYISDLKLTDKGVLHCSVMVGDFKFISDSLNFMIFGSRIRLTNGTDETEGQVEIYLKDEWGTICDNNWDINDANVVCNQLGFLGAFEAVLSGGFGKGSGPIHLNEVHCVGNERSLVDCPANAIGHHNCNHDEDAGVRCIPCPTAAGCEGRVRLVDGICETEGRVEIFLDGEWGTVCDDYWDNSDANVVCNQLGFLGASEAVSRAGFGQGSGPVHINYVQCVGNEKSLVDCPAANAVHHYYCGSHYKDAGVRCIEYPKEYTVSVISDPLPSSIDESDNSFTYLAGSDVNFTCSVIPTPPCDSDYSWSCSTGCFADMEIEQRVNVSGLEVTDEGVLNCSVMINDTIFISNPFELVILQSYTVSVKSYPPGSSLDGGGNSFGYVVGSDVNFTCSVIPTPPSDSEYSWDCSTGCFADGETEQSVDVSDLKVTDIGVLNCSVMINGEFFFSNSFEVVALKNDEKSLSILPTTSTTIKSQVSTPLPTISPGKCCCDEVMQTYQNFSITWNVTAVGDTVVVDCKGDGLTGNVSRTCGADNQWKPAKIFCIRNQFTMLTDQVSSLSNLSNTEQLDQTNSIVETLVSVTKPDEQSLYPQELSSTVDIISTISNITEEVIGMRQPNDTFFEEVTQVFDNVLSPSNEKGWMELQQISSDDSQELVVTAEKFGQLLAQTLSKETPEAIIPKNNIVIKAEIATAEDIGNLTAKGKSLQFPDEDDIIRIGNSFNGLQTKLSIPSQLLSEALNITNDTKLPIVNTVFRNLASILPNVSAAGNSAHPVSAVISSQLSDTQRLVTSIPVELTFDLNEREANSNNATIQRSCAFWDFDLSISSNNDGHGGWSSEGVELVDDLSNNVSVVCHSYHLTSFAVLVSIQESQKDAEAKALTLVSYIGCSISIVCLLLSIFILGVFMYKNYLKGTHVFIHLNLCIALLLGNIVFVSGVDFASDNRGPCVVVAVLLHYLFTSAFCWMLCEGVILYLMLVVVFNNRFNNRLFFFALGWGPGIPIVAISTGIAHDQYGVDYCWISTEKGAIAAFLVPMVVIILLNCVFLGFTLRALYGSKGGKNITGKETDKMKMAKYMIKATIVLLPIFGLTWLIGIISVNAETSVFAWIFAILNSLQGAFILFFHVLRNQEVKSRLFSIKGRGYRPGRRYISSRVPSTRTSNSRKKSAQSDSFGFNQLASPTSTSFGEGYMSNTLDKKELINQPVSEQAIGESACERSATNPLVTKKDLDTVSEAGTIKDSDSGDEGGRNDNTEIDEGNKESIGDENKSPKQIEESSM